MAKDGRGTPGVLGVRREDKNKWERRVPITPEQVVQLVAQGMRIVVQPSTRRVFADEEYRQAGAIIQDDLNECGTSVGVKECPIDALLANRMYLSFSHTIKAQPYNMPLLDALLEKNVRMIDYECITETGMRGSNRLVAFGAFAGYAGAIDFLRGLGERFLALGFSTPLLHIGSSFMYPILDDARRAVKAAGETIGQFGLPAALCPFTVVFTGTGKVSRGALDIFQLLPHEMIEPPALTDLCQGGAVKADRNKLYLSVATAKHMVRRRDGQPFDRKDYYENPDAHVPVFQETVLPYCTAIVNCMYWDPRFPKLFTSADLEQSVRTGQDKLLGVCDITCDENGSGPTKEFTSIEDPFYVYNALTDQVEKSLDGPGVVFHAVDHLPCEIPREASLPPSLKLAPRSVAAMTRCRSSASVLIAVGLAIVASFTLQGCDSDTQAATTAQAISRDNVGAAENTTNVQIRGLSAGRRLPQKELYQLIEKDEIGTLLDGGDGLRDEPLSLVALKCVSTNSKWYDLHLRDEPLSLAISHCEDANDCWGVYEYWTKTIWHWFEKKPYYRLCTADSSVYKYSDPTESQKLNKVHMVKLVVHTQKRCGLDIDVDIDIDEHFGAYHTLEKAYEACMSQTSSCRGVWASEKFLGGCNPLCTPSASFYRLCYQNEDFHNDPTETIGIYSYVNTIYNMRWLPNHP